MLGDVGALARVMSKLAERYLAAGVRLDLGAALPYALHCLAAVAARLLPVALVMSGLLLGLAVPSPEVLAHLPGP